VVHRLRRRQHATGGVYRILPAGASGATFDTHDEAATVLEGILEEVEAPV